MGEAKRKREAKARAYATGQVVPSPTNCPACGSLRTIDVPKDLSPALRTPAIAPACVGKKAAGSRLDGVEHKEFPCPRPI